MFFALRHCLLLPQDGETLTEIVGSPFYVAPEVLKRSYNKAADIWSCGIILYILLSGYPPFTGDSTQAIFRAILTTDIDFASDPWPKISPEAIDCVKRMLVKDWRKRATAEEMLKHAWMKENGCAIDKPIEPEVLKRMKGFGKMNKLQREAVLVIARNMPSQEIQGLREMFKAMDKDGSGIISVAELKEGLAAKGATMAGEAINALVGQMDVDGDGKVSLAIASKQAALGLALLHLPVLHPVASAPAVGAALLSVRSAAYLL